MKKYEHRDRNYLVKLTNYYNKLFYMLVEGYEKQDAKLITKAKVLMKATENIH